MITPSSNEIEVLAKEYSIIPICKEIYADIITPITLLRKISQISKRYYLLESIEGGEKWGRYSFLGFDPILHITCKNKKVTIQDGEEKVIPTETPYEVLRELLEKYKAPKLTDMPPFTGGLVGYFSYGMIAYAEPILKLAESDFPDFDLMLYDKVIAYDHLKQKISIVVNMKTDKVLENYGRALTDLESLTHFIMETVHFPKKTSSGSKPYFECNIT
ncbi:MAG: trpE, partial [Herbinix sp.]|nr:trpE [Herbinix sp.]